MWIAFIILLSAAAVSALYLLMIMPRILNRPDISAFIGRAYAHRGLYGGSIKENTLEAFEAAAAAGYGIELDVQLSRDGEAVVIHDYTLKRTHGIDSAVDSLASGELSLLGVPLFGDVLKLINGRVPLIVELKIKWSDMAVCEKASQLLDGYGGAYCVESFNPLALKWLRAHRPGVVRGQLSSNLLRDGEMGSRALYFALRHLLFNFMTHPDFIAYNHKYKKALSLTLCRKLYGAMTVAWTVRSRDEYDGCLGYFDSVIFEGFGCAGQVTRSNELKK